MERFRTERITDEKDLETITDWMYGWWGTREGYAREAVLESMRHSLNTDRLPMTFGAYLDGTLIGVYQFTNGDLFVRPDVTPWLANVYLDPAYRGRGFGRKLLATVRENADRYLPGSELHLFTTHAGLYEKFGWVFEAEIDTFLEPRIQRLYRLPASGEPN
ncbi:MAG: GNAT family N-acetyltransferase [Clostridia bacterium]|nr:GNAT family N-acetyltransferase [Clostridia bacterium]